MTYSSATNIVLISKKGSYLEEKNNETLFGETD